jgi:quercetin dioxygenase-like cupin family protein
MKVFRVDEVPSAKINGTAESRLYYESPEQGFRIVVTTIPPGHTQNEHRHDYLLDIIYVLEGQVQVSERSGGIFLEETLECGDMVCFMPPAFHNVANKSTETARTLTLKMVTDSGISPDEFVKLFKTDWIGNVG